MHISKTSQLFRYRVLWVRTQRGVSMIELVGIVAALMALVIGLNYKTADFFNKSQALGSDALFRLADNQLRQYIVANGRLPCPDLDGTGISASTCLTTAQQKGYLPYKTLGMADKNYVFGEVPMLYGAYNDGTITFTSSLQVFVPTYADQTNTQLNFVTTTRNMFDFCASLASLKNQSAVTTGLAVAGGNDVYKAVYALALPGQANRDGLPATWSGGPTVINAQYDGLNARSPNQFELPQATITPIYDDRTQYRAASDLHDYFRCEAMKSSVNLLTEAVTMQQQTEDFANSNAKTVEIGLAMNAGLNALSLFKTYKGTGQAASAVTVAAIAATELAVDSATCPIPPFVTCALIPVAAAAVATATPGIAQSTVAIALGVVSLGLQVTATVLYGELNSRTTRPQTVVTVVIPTVSDADNTRLLAAYAASKALAKTAYQAVPSPAPDVTALTSNKVDKVATLTGDIAAVADSTLQGMLNDRLNGSVQTCTLSSTANCSAAGFTAHGDNTVVANYSMDRLASAFTPGVLPSLDNYYQALAQVGANAPSSATITTNSTDPAVLSAQAALASANTALAAVPIVDPATAMNSSNSVVNAYSNLLSAAADFDSKNLNYQTLSTTNGSSSTDVTTAAAQRSTALDRLRTAMGAGYETWDYHGNTSLCGGRGCSWMNGASAATGSSTTQASSGSSTVNNALTAYDNYKYMAIYKKLKDAADAKANSAWSDRNGFKTASCARLQSVTWLGGSSTTSTNPDDWDVSEKLLDSPISGLSCTNSVAAPDYSVAQNAARQAQIAMYCAPQSPINLDYLRLCALSMGTTPAQSSIKGSRDIVDALIVKGIVQ